MVHLHLFGPRAPFGYGVRNHLLPTQERGVISAASRLSSRRFRASHHATAAHLRSLRETALASCASVRERLSSPGTLPPADALDALVRTLELEHELFTRGAFDIAHCDIIDDARQIHAVAREFAALLSLVEERHPGTEHRLQAWNESTRRAMTLQSYLAHESLLGLPATPDEQHKARWMRRAAGIGAAAVAALLLWGFRPAAVGAIITIAVLLLMYRRPAPFSQAERSLIADRWESMLPAGRLTAAKLKRERDALASALVHHGVDLANAEEELIRLNEVRREQAETGDVYHRQNSPIILGYTGSFEVPRFK